ncbi:MAG: DinB family protein [Chloroflexi bacterium]|nr:DinB family protein [Chloroflexota bacterium]
MEVAEFIQHALERVTRSTTRVLTGLNDEELMWRPGPECNSIALILFHGARSEDSFIQERVLGQPQIWESEEWHKKLNMQPSDRGAGLTSEQIVAFHVVDTKTLMSYCEAVRARTMAYLKDKKSSDFDRIVKMARFGDMPVGAVFALVLVHTAEHIGDISYLRGMQRGLNK